MFHHCNHPIRFGHFEHLELPRRCIVTWHLLAANSKLVVNFEPSSEYLLWCWQQRKIVSEYSQIACVRVVSPMTGNPPLGNNNTIKCHFFLQQMFITHLSHTYI